MEVDNNMQDNIQNMPMHHTSFLAVIWNSAKWLLALLFTPAVTLMQTILPEWKNSLENFKLIGGSVIVVLVVVKLVLEIIKLIKK